MSRSDLRREMLRRYGDRRDLVMKTYGDRWWTVGPLAAIAAAVAAVVAFVRRRADA